MVDLKQCFSSLATLRYVDLNSQDSPARMLGYKSFSQNRFLTYSGIQFMNLFLNFNSYYIKTIMEICLKESTKLKE